MIAPTPADLTTAYSGSIDAYFTLSRKAFEGVEKLVELNLSVARATLQESATLAKDLLAIKDPQELFAFQSAQLQPNAEKLASYSRHLYDIATQTQAEFSRLTEARLAEGNQRFVALIDSATQNAPAGSEGAVALVKSAIAAANSAYDSLNKAARQVVEMTESNVAAATNATLKTTAQAANSVRTKKAA